MASIPRGGTLRCVESAATCHGATKTAKYTRARLSLVQGEVQAGCRESCSFIGKKCLEARSSKHLVASEFVSFRLSSHPPLSSSLRRLERHRRWRSCLAMQHEFGEFDLSRFESVEMPIACNWVSPSELEQFVFQPEAVENLKELSEMSTNELLHSLVKSTSRLARNPISQFFVGAAGLGASGRIYLGVNLEFPGLPLWNSVHAEQFLIANAIQHQERHLLVMACNVVPCGHCRQFLQEIRHAEDLSFVLPEDATQAVQLGELLPHRFGPKDLLEDNFPRLMEVQDNGLRLGASFAKSSYYRNLGDFMPHLFNILVNEAYTAANSSYAPYSNCPSGVALLTDNCNIYSGGYMESAAYNPSLPPLQAALVALVAQGGGEDFRGIRHVVLVERRGRKVSQEATIRMVLRQVSPNAILYVVHVEGDGHDEVDSLQEESSALGNNGGLAFRSTR